jgi:hypothetical protein
MKLFALAAALALAIGMASPADARTKRPQPTAAFEGAWSGAYYQGGVATPFALTLARDGTCAGVITETVSDGPKRATFSCSITSQNGARLLRLTKTYDGTGGWSHDVEYVGALSPDGRFVAGHWANAGFGELFHMSRAEGLVS